MSRRSRSNSPAGKTIENLALLRELKENGKTFNPPKSLYLLTMAIGTNVLHKKQFLLDCPDWRQLNGSVHQLQYVALTTEEQAKKDFEIFTDKRIGGFHSEGTLSLMLSCFYDKQGGITLTSSDEEDDGPKKDSDSDSDDEPKFILNIRRNKKEDSSDEDEANNNDEHLVIVQNNDIVDNINVSIANINIDVNNENKQEVVDNVNVSVVDNSNIDVNEGSVVSSVDDKK